MNLEWRNFLAAELARAIVEVKDSTLIFARTYPLPAYRPISLMPPPRVIIMLEGRKRIEFTDGKELISTIIGPGDIIFAEPYGWTQPFWDFEHKFMSLVYFPDYIRCIYVKNIPEETDSPFGPKSKIWYHTAKELCESGNLLISAISKFHNRSEDNLEIPLTMLECLLKISYRQLVEDEANFDSKAHYTWLTIRDFLRDNLHQAINRDEVAQRFKLNPCYVSRLFAQQGEGFNSYLKRLRMEQANHLLLEHQDLNIGEIAFRCGFNSTGYFIKTFTQYYGTTPGIFRQGKNKK